VFLEGKVIWALVSDGGTLSSAGAVGTPSNPWIFPGTLAGLAVGDFDNDGKVDAVIATSSSSTSGTVYLVSSLLQSGTVNEAAPVVTDGVAIEGIQAADFNGDGLLDFAIADSQGWTFALNAGGRTFVKARRVALPGTVFQTALLPAPGGGPPTLVGTGAQITLLSTGCR
jgi:hypothetical protein